MTILFLTTVMPGCRSTGSEVASQAFIDALRRAGHRVLVLGYRRPGAHPPAHPDDHVVCERPIESRLAGWRAAGWMLASLVRRLPYSAAKYRSRAYGRAIGAAFAERPELAIVDHAQMGWAIPHLGAGMARVYLAHNVERVLYEEAATEADHPLLRVVNRREAARIGALERLLAGTAGEVWALTSEDARELEALTHDRPPRAFDLPVDVTAMSDPEQATADVRLLGTWTWGPNAHGLAWFLGEVAPRLPREISVEIAGAGTANRPGPTPNVRFCGRVPSAQAFLRGGRALAIPATAGAGVQIKTLDAIASGVPVVATTRALRGIDDPPVTVAVADDPGKFAAALIAAVAASADRDSRAAARAWNVRRSERFHAATAQAVARMVAG